LRIAVLADVHGNLEALGAVFEDLEGRSADRLFFLGDAVGYGADPEPCVEMLMNRASRLVVGNHDHASADPQEDLDAFHPDAAAALIWTRGALSRRSAEVLRALPLSCEEESIHLVHGSPCRPQAWEYVLSERDAERAFGVSRSRFVLVGHTHIPAAHAELECRRLFSGVFRRVRSLDPGSLRLDPRYRYILNPGSVGQPRDGNPRAAYAILDSESGTYELVRVAYDVEKASEKIRRAGLPGILAERLRWGR
jgi:diadenosine tetraphosphatase ApaH/serine/threonine PP2A family protein phosphatase